MHGRLESIHRDAAAMIALVIALGFSATPSSAYDYHPLDPGRQWYYESDLGETELMTIAGERVVLGALTTVRREELTAQTVENFWTVDGDGHLFLHGAVNYTYSFELAYLPPIRMVDAPLELDKSWTTPGIHLYDLQGVFQGSIFDYSLNVFTEGLVTVPAGEFYAYGVGELIAVPLLRSSSGECFDLLGRRIPAPPSAETDHPQVWYVDGLGVVKMDPLGYEPEAFKLHWWTGPTPVEPGSWGSIKTLFFGGQLPSSSFMGGQR